MDYPWRGRRARAAQPSSSGSTSSCPQEQQKEEKRKETRLANEYRRKERSDGHLVNEYPQKERSARPLVNEFPGKEHSDRPLELADLSQITIPQIPAYNILKRFCLAKPFSNTTLRSCFRMLMKNMVDTQLNIQEICKSLYVLSCLKDRSIGNEVWSQFFSTLEEMYKDFTSNIERTEPEKIHKFTNFFLMAVYFMRNPLATPKHDIIAALFIAISKLNPNLPDHRNLYCLAVAWLSGFVKNIESGSLYDAFVESSDSLRDSVLKINGNAWALACLEAAANDGNLPIESEKYYISKLGSPQVQLLDVTSRVILVPKADRDLFTLPNNKFIMFD